MRAVVYVLTAVAFVAVPLLPLLPLSFHVDRRLSFIQTGNPAGWLMHCLAAGDLEALRADGGNIAVLRELRDPKGRSAVMLAAAAKAQSLEVTQWLVQTAGADPS